MEAEAREAGASAERPSAEVERPAAARRAWVWRPASAQAGASAGQPGAVGLPEAERPRQFAAADNLDTAKPRASFGDLLVKFGYQPYDRTYVLKL